MNPVYEPLHKALMKAADRGEDYPAEFEGLTDIIQQLANESREIFLREPPLLQITPKVTVCGDIHGQYYDLLRIINCGGPVSENNQYLFLGDYVDRGKQSLETLCYLLLQKVTYPKSFFLIRGNHECASINRVYGFYQECQNRLGFRGIKLWKCFTDCFNVMPIAALIEGKIFCVHGGLSPELTKFDQINNLLRPTDVPETGLLCDLLWSDPDPSIKFWDNNDRGVSYTFGKEAVEHFCQSFNIELICRAHQVVEDGYEFFANQKLITLFSAPNYGGEFDNSAAMMIIDVNLQCSLQVLRASTMMKTHKGRASSPRPNEKRPKAQQSSSTGPSRSSVY